MSKAAELAGITTIEFKDVLKDRGIKIKLPEEHKDKIDKQVMEISAIIKKR
jgi:predicted HTH domain antitoxin